MRVLFVDDVRDIRELYSLVFSREGFVTLTAGDGIEALTAIRESPEPFDVVVLDVDMMRMDGWETLQAIRALPQGEHLPVIMFSAYRQELQTRAAVVAANAVLTKPATPQELIEEVKRVVQEARQEVLGQEPSA